MSHPVTSTGRIRDLSSPNLIASQVDSSCDDQHDSREIIWSIISNMTFIFKSPSIHPLIFLTHYQIVE